MSPANPYSAGGIVKDPAMFFDRDEELERIRDRPQETGFFRNNPVSDTHFWRHL